MKAWTAIMICLLINGMAMQQASAQRTVSRVADHKGPGYLGVGVAEVDEERAKALKLKDDHGVVVMNVGEDTPAANAGLKEMDVILEFNGQRVEGVEQFIRMVREMPAGRSVHLQVFRNGSLQSLSPTLTARSDNGRLGSHIEAHMPELPEMPFGDLPMPPTPPRLYLPDTPHPVLSWRQPAIGIEGEPLGGQLAEYFGVSEGVLVRSVTQDSPAEKAGVKAGDVVTRVSGKAIRTPQELLREVRSRRAGKTPMTLTVMRNHKEINVPIKPAESWRKDDGDDEN